MGAREDLENLIKGEIFKDHHVSMNDSAKNLTSEIADELHYAFETSKGLNGKDGTFLFSSKETIAYFQNIGYIDKKSPIEQFHGRYAGELNQKAREMYGSLNKEGNYSTSNLAKIPLYNSPNPEPNSFSYDKVFEPPRR